MKALLFTLALALIGCSESDEPKPDSVACIEATHKLDLAKKAEESYIGTDRAELAALRKDLATALELKEQTCGK